MCDFISAVLVKTGAAMPVCDVRCNCPMQGSLLDNQELLESLNQAKAKAATINASLQESRNVQVCFEEFSICGTCLRPVGRLDCTKVPALSFENFFRHESM